MDFDWTMDIDKEDTWVLKYCVETLANTRGSRLWLILNALSKNYTREQIEEMLSENETLAARMRELVDFFLDHVDWSTADKAQFKLRWA